MSAVVSMGLDELVLRVPTGRFMTVTIANLHITPHYSSLGHVRALRWSDERIARWHEDKRRFDVVGRRAARLIDRAGRSIYGDGLAQRALARAGVPLTDPPDREQVMTGSFIGMAGPGTATQVHLP